MSRSSSTSRVSVYDGRRFRGTVKAVDGTFVAISPAGEVIGKFETQREAANAISGDGEKTCS